MSIIETRLTAIQKIAVARQRAKAAQPATGVRDTAMAPWLLALLRLSDERITAASAGSNPQSGPPYTSRSGPGDLQFSSDGRLTPPSQDADTLSRHLIAAVGRIHRAAQRQ